MSPELETPPRPSTSLRSAPSGPAWDGIAPRVPAIRKKRRTGLWIALFILVVGVGGAGYALKIKGLGATGKAATIYTVERRSFPLTLEEKATLKASESTNIICDIDGEAKILKLIPEGETVKEGDFLVEFARDRIDEQLQQELAQENNAKNALISSQNDYETHEHESTKKIRAAERALNQAILDFQKYNEADWPQQKTDHELAVKNAEKEFERAKQRLESSQRLREREFITEPDLLNDEIAFAKADAELTKARLALDALLTYTHPKDLDAKKAAVSDAEEELAFVKKSAEDMGLSKKADIEAKKLSLELVQQKIKRLKEQLSKTTIMAPGPGLVVYGDADQPWRREDLGEGKTVWKGTVVMQLPDLTTMHAVARIHESKTDLVKVGQKVEVRAEGSGDTVYTGKVYKIGALPGTENRWLNPEVKEYETEIRLDGENLPLRPGGTAKVKIILGEVKDVMAVPIQAVWTKGRKSFVFKETGGGIQPVEVELGRSNDQYVEISKGLEAGDQVHLAVEEGMLSLLPEPEQGENEAASDESKVPPDRASGNGGSKRRGGNRRPPG